MKLPIEEFGQPKSPGAEGERLAGSPGFAEGSGSGVPYHPLPKNPSIRAAEIAWK